MALCSSVFIFVTFLCGFGISIDVSLTSDGTQVEDKSSNGKCDLKPRLKKNLEVADILSLHNVTCGATSVKRFSGETLGYITPWNNKGYDVVKKYGGKFTYLSPVWLQLRDKGSKVEVTGQHDIDTSWIAEVKQRCVDLGYEQCPKFVPRVVWESKRSDRDTLKSAARAILQVIKKNEFDGLVLEAPIRASFLPFFTLLNRNLKKQSDGKATFILVLPPSVQASDDGQSLQGITPEMFKQIAQDVDRFSLMTYDFSMQRGQVGPNFPVNWAKEVVQSLLAASESPDEQKSLASKILLGVPFYGYDNLEAVISHGYLAVLQRPDAAVKVDKDTMEHYTLYNKGKEPHIVYYPSPWAIEQRLQLAKKLGLGVSIWELGQALDYFFDLF